MAQPQRIFNLTVEKADLNNKSYDQSISFSYKENKSKETFLRTTSQELCYFLNHSLIYCCLEP